MGKMNEYEQARQDLKKAFNVLMGLMNDRETLREEIEQAQAKAGEARADALLAGGKAAPAAGAELGELRARLGELEVTMAAVNRRWLAALQAERAAARVELAIQAESAVKETKELATRRQQIALQLEGLDAAIGQQEAKRQRLTGEAATAEQFLTERVGLWQGSVEAFEVALETDESLPIDRAAGFELVVNWRKGAEVHVRNGRLRSKAFAEDVAIYFLRETGEILDSRIASALNEWGMPLPAGRTISLTDIADHRESLEAHYGH